MGIVSVILWSLLLIVAFKYAILIMRADNRSEGGIVALLALLDVRRAPSGSWRASLLIVGLIAAALLYGDGVVTLAISVLSAVEGLKLDAPALASALVPCQSSSIPSCRNARVRRSIVVCTTSATICRAFTGSVTGLPSCWVVRPQRANWARTCPVSGSMSDGRPSSSAPTMNPSISPAGLAAPAVGAASQPRSPPHAFVSTIRRLSARAVLRPVVELPGEISGRA